MTQRKRRRYAKGSGDRLRDDLLLAAEEILEEVGDSRRLSVRAVASRAGVTPPSLYRHFPDKATLVRTVLERRFGAYRHEVEGAEAGASSPFDALSRRSHAYIQFAERQPGHYRLLFSATELGPVLTGTEGVQPHPGAASFWSLVTLIQRCLDVGAPAVHDDADLLAHLLWAQLHGLADLRITKPEMPWPPPAQMVDVALRGLGLVEPARS